MKGDQSKISPIMTNSESIFQFGNNAYGKPATALNILRETIMGRELFDYSFKIYAERWAFKHPTPADFFRTMEDASGVDLDWFWRGWFYTTDYVDISMDNVKWLQIDTRNPNIEKAILKKSKMDEDESFIGNIRNKTEIETTYNERDKSLNDFYTSYDEFEVTEGCKILNHELRNLDFPKSAIIGGVIRNGEGYTAKGNFSFQVKDRVVVLSRPECIRKVEGFFK